MAVISESTTVKSDFSILKCEANTSQQTLVDLSLASILHPKQYETVVRLSSQKNFSVLFDICSFTGASVAVSEESDFCQGF